MGWLAIARSANRSRSAAVSMKRCAARARRTKRTRRGSHTASTVATGIKNTSKPVTVASRSMLAAWWSAVATRLPRLPDAASNGRRSWSPRPGTCAAELAASPNWFARSRAVRAVSRAGPASAATAPSTRNPTTAHATVQTSAATSPASCPASWPRRSA